MAEPMIKRPRGGAGGAGGPVPWRGRTHGRRLLCAASGTGLKLRIGPLLRPRSSSWCLYAVLSRPSQAMGAALGDAGRLWVSSRLHLRTVQGIFPRNANGGVVRPAWPCCGSVVGAPRLLRRKQIRTFAAKAGSAAAVAITGLGGAMPPSAEEKNYVRAGVRQALAWLRSVGADRARRGESPAACG